VLEHAFLNKTTFSEANNENAGQILKISPAFHETLSADLDDRVGQCCCRFNRFRIRLEVTLRSDQIDELFRDIDV
jgi:hypothetical protein